MTPEERAADYHKRVQVTSPLIDALLKKNDLNLGGQFDTARWPGGLIPVAVYLDVKDYDAVEIIVPEKEPEEETTEKDAELSPIQPDDLEEKGKA